MRLHHQSISFHVDIIARVRTQSALLIYRSLLVRHQHFTIKIVYYLVHCSYNLAHTSSNLIILQLCCRINILFSSHRHFTPHPPLGRTHLPLYELLPHCLWLLASTCCVAKIFVALLLFFTHQCFLSPIIFHFSTFTHSRSLFPTIIHTSTTIHTFSTTIHFLNNNSHFLNNNSHFLNNNSHFLNSLLYHAMPRVSCIRPPESPCGRHLGASMCSCLRVRLLDAVWFCEVFW